MRTTRGRLIFAAIGLAAIWSAAVYRIVSSAHAPPAEPPPAPPSKILTTTWKRSVTTEANGELPYAV
jgi:hypothetical protein